MKILILTMLRSSQIRLKHLYLINYHFLALKMRKPRTVWALEREERWFDEMVQRIDDNDAQLDWKADFRLIGRTFQDVVL